MRPEALIEQITLIILALLDDKSTFEQYNTEKFTNKLVINDIESTTASSLAGMRISFRYTPTNKRDTLLRPIDHQLFIGYHKAGGTIKTVLLTLDALINDRWVHQPLRNIPYVVERLKEYRLDQAD